MNLGSVHLGIEVDHLCVMLAGEAPRAAEDADGYGRRFGKRERENRPMEWYTCIFGSLEHKIVSVSALDIAIVRMCQEALACRYEHGTQNPQ